MMKCVAATLRSFEDQMDLNEVQYTDKLSSGCKAIFYQRNRKIDIPGTTTIYTRRT